MKFLKKLALAYIAPSGSLSHYHSPDFAYTDASISCCLHNLEKLTNLLNKYLLIRKKTNLLKRGFGHFNQKIINTRLVSFRSCPVIDWAPLIKATSPIKNGNANNEDQTNNRSNNLLEGRSVLCVGGRIKFYPEYNQLIENSGGNLMIFHGDSNDHLDNLPQLLEEADMIICPIDCVNHEAFFIVKYYCKYSDKPCILLDRSEVNTFCRGINILSIMATKETFN